ncbi:MAG: LON peptidase substrate-binding domain-containing protein [Gemmatimonadales bacterium]
MSHPLPIFPLPLVLFPGATQPLHIFEPRYRCLLADCLAGDRRFGIVYASPAGPGEAEPVPAPGATGCVAVIRAAEALADGRSNIVTVGERRFAMLEWVASDRPYRVARVEPFDDDQEDAAESARAAGVVRQRFARLMAALAALTDHPPPDQPLPDDPQGLSFCVAAALTLGVETKAALLASRGTASRLRRIDALLGPLTEDAERRAAVRRRARGNGRGGAQPRIERFQ